MLSIRRLISSLAEHTRSEFHRFLSMRGMESSLAEHTQKCLKVEYFCRIEYNFQKSRVTDPWDHRVSVSAVKFKKKFMLVYLYLPAQVKTVL
jgi:hypothetical protein